MSSALKLGEESTPTVFEGPTNLFDIFLFDINIEIRAQKV